MALIDSTPEGQVNKYSILAGASYMIPIPGVAVLANAGIQLAMYFAINKAMGVKLSKNKVKCIGTFLASQVAGLGWATLLEFAKLIPGVGMFTAVAQCVMVGSVTYACGMAYLKILENVDLERVSEDKIQDVLVANTPSEQEMEAWRKHGADMLKKEKSNMKARVSEAEIYAN